MIPFILLLVGLSLMVIGIWFAWKGLGEETAGGEALRGFKVSGPAWLILVVIGVGCIIAAGTVEFNDVSVPKSLEDGELPQNTDPFDTFDDFEFDGPFDYGDDPFLDSLWDDCEFGDGSACDQLYQETPVGSEYEDFGATCGWRFDEWILDCQQVLR